MKKRIKFLALAALLIIVAVFTGCYKEYSILVSTQDLRFGLEAGRDTLIIRANCKWTITKNDDADWYSISPMSGSANDSIVIVTVNDYSNGDYRGASFVVNSPGGHVYRTVFVSQNKLDFYGMINKVYGVMKVEHWNTDFYGMIVEDTYQEATYNPYDTTTGYLMYYLENGIGYQRDHHTDTVAWWGFNYDFDPDSCILHIEFHLADGGLDHYDPEVLCASDSLYRVLHEYKPNFWERADLRKVATVIPAAKEEMMKKAAKRKEGQPIFMFD